MSDSQIQGIAVSKAQSNFHPLPLPLCFAHSCEGVGVSQFSFGWNGRVTLQTKGYENNLSNYARANKKTHKCMHFWH